MKLFPKMALFWLLASLLCSVLTIILHIFVLPLLFKVKLVNYSLSQKYLLVSLCLTELCCGISMFLAPLGELIGFADNFQKYLHTFQLTTLYFMYFSVMIILTLDRFLEFHFSIKYFLIWSSKKTLTTLSIVSCISLINFICFLPISVKIISYRKYLIGYIFAPVACIYLLLASLTYYQIFKKIKENRRKSRELREYISNEQPSQRKKQIQVFVPSFIILTFILFNIFPIFLALLRDFIFTMQDGCLVFCLSLWSWAGWQTL